MATRYRDWFWVPNSFQNKTYNVLIHAHSTLCRSHSSLYKEKTAKKWRNKALLRYSLLTVTDNVLLEYHRSLTSRYCFLPMIQISITLSLLISPKLPKDSFSFSVLTFYKLLVPFLRSSTEGFLFQTRFSLVIHLYSSLMLLYYMLILYLHLPLSLCVSLPCSLS